MLAFPELTCPGLPQARRSVAADNIVNLLLCFMCNFQKMIINLEIEPSEQLFQVALKCLYLTQANCAEDMNLCPMLSCLNLASSPVLGLNNESKQLFAAVVKW